MADALDDLQGQIRHRVQLLLASTETLIPTRRRTLLDPDIRFDLRGQTAGQAGCAPGQRPVLRFNMDLAEHYPEDFLEVTVAHEVAHLVTYALYPRARPHGREWQHVMRHFGIENASRCHNYEVVQAVKRQRRWTYRCGCQTHQLSTTRHRRIESDTTRYHCRLCGDELIFAD